MYIQGRGSGGVLIKRHHFMSPWNDPLWEGMPLPRIPPLPGLGEEEIIVGETQFSPYRCGKTVHLSGGYIWGWDFFPLWG